MHFFHFMSHLTTSKRTHPANATRFVLLLMTVACFAAAAHAQSNFWNSKYAYLGQPRPSDTPQVFAPGLLADPGMVVMGRIAITPDGKEIYYHEQKGWGAINTAKTKVFRFDGRKWNGPTVVFQKFVGPALSPDGNTMYFAAHHQMVSRRTKDGWSTPEVFIEDTRSLYDLMPTTSGVFYVASEPDNEDKKFGITFSFSTMTISDGHATIKSLGRPLNEPGFNGDFYVAPDESYMIVSAKETKTLECELYISFRKPDSEWTVPVSLGPKINDGPAHRWAQYVSPDGKYLFYTRATTSRDTAVYWVRFDHLLKSLRPKQQ
jgi:hypothetical protein